MQELYKLKDMLCEDLKEYSKKEKLDMQSLNAIDTLCHSLKNLCKIIHDYEGYPEEDYSQAMMPRMPRYSYGNGMGMTDMSYARGRGANAKRDSMGRYSSRNGGNYSNHGDLRMEIQEIMQDAPNDYVRQKLMDAMEGM